MSDKVKKYSIAILKYIILIFVAFVVIYPLIGVFLASFKTKIEYLSTDSMELPENFKNFSNYATVMIKGNLLRGFVNTIFIIVFACIISTYCAQWLPSACPASSLRARDLLTDFI